ncbi:hypothetical protein DITRI_Ditri18aG0093700 [Diplodiscus trichospermus]
MVASPFLITETILALSKVSFYAHATIKDLRLEYVVAVDGVVPSRPTESVNEKMKTGSVELTAEHVHILNVVRSKLPLMVTATSEDDASDFVKEEIRLR